MGNIMVIVDGMHDQSFPQLGGRTPWEYGQCHHMASIKDRGSYGQLVTCPSGYSVDSLTCILTLLGVAPEQIPHGRSYLEALACGITVQPEDIVFRCNFVAVDQRGHLQSSCGQGLATADMGQMVQVAQRQLRGTSWQLAPIGGYKNLLIGKGLREHGQGTVTYPPHQHQGLLTKQLIPTGSLISHQLAKVFQESMDWFEGYGQGEKQYGLYPWGMAYQQPIQSFYHLHKQRGAVVCSTEIVRGIALAMEMDAPSIPGTTADTDTDLRAKQEMALSLAQEYDFVLLHINGADEASHRKDPLEKAEFLQRVDKEVIGPLINQLTNGQRLLICSDHTTSAKTGQHVGDLQPFFLYEQGAQGQGDIGVVEKGIGLLIDN